MTKLYQEISSFIDSQKENMLADLITLVSLEGHATEPENVKKAMDFYVGELRKLGITDISSFEIAENRAPLICAVWGGDRPGAPIIFSGHFDTVHLSGAFGNPATRMENGNLHGPGAKDCKGGCIIALYILKALMHIGYQERPIKLILVSDEEECHRGSIADEIIIRESQGALCAFNMEPGDMFNRFVTARKTFYQYDLIIHGVTGHAGNAFLETRNPINEAAFKISDIIKLTDLDAGTFVSPTVIHSGRQFSTIPAECVVSVSACFQTDAEALRIMQEMKRIAETSYTPDTHTDLHVVTSQLPAYLESPGIAKIFNFTNQLAAEIGLPLFGKAHRGAASDAGNFMKANIPTLDGCGIVGDGGHTLAEYAVVDSMYTRSKLFAYEVSRFEELIGENGRLLSD